MEALNFAKISYHKTKIAKKEVSYVFLILCGVLIEFSGTPVHPHNDIFGDELYFSSIKGFLRVPILWIWPSVAKKNEMQP
jgi:hypothetical protein